jgi:hypothetical protein
MLPTPYSQEITLTTIMFSHFEGPSDPSHPTKKSTSQVQKLYYQIYKNIYIPYKEFSNLSTNDWVDKFFIAKFVICVT